MSSLGSRWTRTHLKESHIRIEKGRDNRIDHNMEAIVTITLSVINRSLLGNSVGPVATFGL
jgi:hypothetical protein